MSGFSRKDTEAASGSGYRASALSMLTLLRDAVRELAAEPADGDAFRDPDRVGRFLTGHRLTADAFLSAYARPAIPGN
jgi:hypothetical protein